MKKTVRLWRQDPNLNPELEKDPVTRSRKKARKTSSPYADLEKELVEKMRERRTNGLKVSNFWLRSETKLLFGNPGFSASEG